MWPGDQCSTQREAEAQVVYQECQEQGVAWAVGELEHSVAVSLLLLLLLLLLPLLPLLPLLVVPQLLGVSWSQQVELDDLAWQTG